MPGPSDTSKPGSSSSPQTSTSGQQQVLAATRKEIDAIDEELVLLLNRRARISKRVGRIKKHLREEGDVAEIGETGETGETADTPDLPASPVLRPAREKALLERLGHMNPGPLPEGHLRAIYREILSSSRALQRPQTVAYLGPEGTFSYFAGLEYLGRSVSMQPARTITAVFDRVATGEVDMGVVPLENSLQGTVGTTLDCLLSHPVHIQAEVYYRVSHCLLSRATQLAGVRKVVSHVKALEQCSAWLAATLPTATLTPVESTAAAARMAAEDDTVAAVGHKRLADIHGLDITAARIEDAPDNWTRFLVIAPVAVEDEANEKTSVVFTTPDKPGALGSILDVLARHSVNVSKLESRPLAGEKWKYCFFADLDVDLSHRRYAPMLKELAAHSLTLKNLGSYPEGPHLDGGPA